MRKLIGYCGVAERYKVWWVEGEWIAVPDANVVICTDTRDMDVALAICRRNLKGWVTI